MGMLDPNYYGGSAGSQYRRKAESYGQALRVLNREARRGDPGSAMAAIKVRNEANAAGFSPGGIQNRAEKLAGMYGWMRGLNQANRDLALKGDVARQNDLNALGNGAATVPVRGKTAAEMQRARMLYYADMNARRNGTTPVAAKGAKTTPPPAQNWTVNLPPGGLDLVGDPSMVNPDGSSKTKPNVYPGAFGGPMAGVDEALIPVLDENLERNKSLESEREQAAQLEASRLAFKRQEDLRRKLDLVPDAKVATAPATVVTASGYDPNKYPRGFGSEQPQLQGPPEPPPFRGPPEPEQTSLDIIGETAARPDVPQQPAPQQQPPRRVRINDLTGLPYGYLPGDELPEGATKEMKGYADASVSRQIAADPRMQPGYGNIMAGPPDKPMTGDVTVGAPKAIVVPKPISQRAINIANTGRADGYKARTQREIWDRDAKNAANEAARQDHQARLARLGGTFLYGLMPDGTEATPESASKYEAGLKKRTAKR